MKKFTLLFALLISAMCMAQDYELRVLTFEDKDVKEGWSSVVEKASKWSDVIDPVQQMGEMLYGENNGGGSEQIYSWYDGGNTFLFSELLDAWGTYAFYSGGEAVSHYCSKNYEDYGNYMYQLTVYRPNGSNEISTSGGGHNGSNNFCIHFGYIDDTGYGVAEVPSVKFNDGVARVIDHVYVCLTTYLYNVLLNGNSLSGAMGDDGKFYVEARGFAKADDEQPTKKVSMCVADKNGIITDWTKWDLSGLGAIEKLEFNMYGEGTGMDNNYGLSQPAYFAWDDMAVRFPKPAKTTEATVTMNNVSKTMTLVNKATGTSVDVGTPTSNKYTFTVEEGTYVLTGYDTDGSTVNGTMELNISENNNNFTIFTVTAYATNSGWVYGTDYTIEHSVITREGEQLVTTLGDSKTAGRKTFLVLNGNTYFCDFVPTAAHAGYATLYRTGTVTANVTAAGAIPEVTTVTISAPAGATVFVGRKTAHFVSFIEEVPTKVENNTYTYSLAKGLEYNYRVSKAGELTNGGLFTADNTKITCTNADFTAKSPKWIDRDVKSNGGYNVADIFLNINAQEHLKLSKGATYDLLTLRNWEVINTVTANYFLEPDYHFTITDLNGNESNAVVTIDADGTLHAVNNGTAIVTVTYDAICLKGMVGGEYWSAIWPENTGVFVVTVGDAESGIDLGMTINETNENLIVSGLKCKMVGAAYDADFDVLYFPDTETYYPYTFKPTNVKSVKVAYPTIGTNAATYSGFGTQGVSYNSETGEYTVQVKLGRQIVQLTNEAGVSEYQVLVGKPVHIEATAEGRTQTGTFRPGDKVNVQLSGLYHPANKLAGIHNFNATTIYQRNGAELKSASNQYTFCSTPAAQAVSFTIPEDYDISKGADTLKAGIIKVGGFGDPIGNHRNTSKQFGRGANFTAISQQAIFGALPQIILPLEALPADKTLSFNTNVTDCTITVKDYKGNVLTANEEGVYTVNSYDYTYLVEKKGYKSLAGQVQVTDASPANIVENITLEAIADDDTGWDGLTTSYEPDQESDWYIIKSGYHLAWFAAKVNGGTLTIKGKLANDISLDDYNWTPIGGSTAAKGFKGKFDGQNNNINDLYINATTTYQALFGYVQNGEITNLTVAGEVTSTGNYAAGIAAYFNASNMTNCRNLVAVNGKQYVGGLTSYASAAKITSCSNAAKIVASGTYASGITSYAAGATEITLCSNEADIAASTTYAAGITAYIAAATGKIINCYNTGTISGTNYVAGIAANVSNASATLNNVYNIGEIKGTGANVGAIRGHKTNGSYDKIYASKAYAMDGEATVKTTILDMQSFENGEVAYLLGEPFGQTIGKDAYPVLNGATVYRHEINGSVIYSNSEELPSENAVATFENEEGGIQLSATEPNWLSATPDNPGKNTWTSGDYIFYTYMDNGYGTPYYYGFYASNETENTSTGWTEPYRSAKGGAFEGDNFAIWTNDYYGSNSIVSKNPLPATGFYVTNNAYTAYVMAHGGNGAKPFAQGDYLNLVCLGKLAGVETGKVTVKLAENTNYIKEWTYVDLSELGQVNEVVFSMEGSDSGEYGLNTPAYFCLDNFGATKPENYEAPAMSSLAEIPSAVENVQFTAPNAARKVLINGHIFIIRGNEMYTIEGRKVQ